MRKQEREQINVTALIHRIRSLPKTVCEALAGGGDSDTHLEQWVAWILRQHMADMARWKTLRQCHDAYLKTIDPVLLKMCRKHK